MKIFDEFKIKNFSFFILSELLSGWLAAGRVGRSSLFQKLMAHLWLHKTQSGLGSHFWFHIAPQALKFTVSVSCTWKGVCIWLLPRFNVARLCYQCAFQKAAILSMPFTALGNLMMSCIILWPVEGEKSLTVVLIPTLKHPFLQS